MNNDVIAVIAGKEITQADFEEFKRNLPAEQQSFLQNPEALEYFKENFIGLNLFAELGREQKMNETEEFKAVIGNVERDILSQMAMRDVLNSVQVTDDEAKVFFDEHKSEFQKPESAKAKHILMDSEDALKDIKKDIENGTITFEDAAKENSTCPSGQKGGDLGEFSRGQMVKEFEDATFAAKIGDIVGPIQTQFGFHLIKVENRTEPGAASFEDARDAAVKGAMQQKQKDVYDAKIKELKEKYCK